MPLDPDTAAQVAADYGLTVADAEAISNLAATKEEAQLLASKFGTRANSNQEINERIRARAKAKTTVDAGRMLGLKPLPKQSATSKSFGEWFRSQVRKGGL